MNDIERALDQVAGDLEWLESEPVFLGGATIGLFLDDFGRSQLRPTLDVDCIVPQVLTRAAWWALEYELRARRWSPDAEGPLCRYRSPHGVLVDLVPEDPEVLGFAGRWYPTTVAGAERRKLVTGRAVLVPTPAHLVACKMDAWTDRGRRDPYASKDLEDLVALLDGCRELEASVQRASLEVRGAIASGFAEVLANRTYREAALAQLPRGGDPRAQEVRVVDLMVRLSVAP